jgi:actin-related protein
MAISDSVKNGPIDMRRDLMGNIVLCGGCSMFPGLADRLEKELIAVAPPRAVINILHDRTAAYRSWLGGAVFGLMDSSRRQWMHDIDYSEQGKEFVANFPNNPFAV